MALSINKFFNPFEGTTSTICHRTNKTNSTSPLGDRGFGVASIQFPLSTPSLRDSNPALLDRSWANIVFVKAHKTQSENLPQFNARRPLPFVFFLFVFSLCALLAVNCVCFIFLLSPLPAGSENHFYCKNNRICEQSLMKTICFF